jgi:hypothetical protein
MQPAESCVQSFGRQFTLLRYPLRI